MGNSGCLPLGKPVATESYYPTYGACWVFSCFHNPLNSDMDYRIFYVRTDVNAWGCTRGCRDTVIESALKVDCGRKIPCRTGESNLRQRHTCPTFLPTHVYVYFDGMCFTLKRSSWLTAGFNHCFFIVLNYTLPRRSRISE